jgi:hypothetical protein
MPSYEISVYCKDCGGEHPILMRIHLDDGPDQKQSFAEFFQGRSMPPQATAIKGRSALCPKTGRKFQIETDKGVFLVPSSSFKREFHDS